MLLLARQEEVNYAVVAMVQNMFMQPAARTYVELEFRAKLYTFGIHNTRWSDLCKKIL